MADLQHLRELSDAASPGEWRVTHEGPDLHGFPTAASIAREGHSNYGWPEEDAEFVVAAVNHVRSVLQAVPEWVCGWTDEGADCSPRDPCDPETCRWTTASGPLPVLAGSSEFRAVADALDDLYPVEITEEWVEAQPPLVRAAMVLVTRIEDPPCL